jgi:hypothetical protein
MEKRRLVIEVVDDATAEVLRRKTGPQRLRIADEMYRTAVALIQASVVATHSDWPPERVQREIARRISRGAV